MGGVGRSTAILPIASKIAAIRDTIRIHLHKPEKTDSIRILRDSVDTFRASIRDGPASIAAMMKIPKTASGKSAVRVRRCHRPRRRTIRLRRMDSRKLIFQSGNFFVNR